MTDCATVTDLRREPRHVENCKQPDTNPDAWFPPEPGPDDNLARAEYEENARILCAGCPLIADCLYQALADESRYGVMAHGVFGGRAPWERDNLRRSDRRLTLRLAVAS